MRIFFLIMLVVFSASAYAGFFKWMHSEALPTVFGQRQINIDPSRITITHNGKTYLEINQDSASIKIGDISIKTTQLRKRLAQAGCIYASGNPFRCAPDILEREINAITNGKYESQIKQYPNIYYELEKNYQAQTIKSDCVARPLFVSHITCLNLANGWQKVELSRPANKIALRYEFKLVIPTKAEIKEMFEPPKNDTPFMAPNFISIQIPKATLTDDETPYEKEFPYDTILIYVPDLGTSSISTTKNAIKLPYPVQELFLRVNTKSTFNNSGTVAIIFSMSETGK